jgi:hypothetical protein
MGSNAAVRDRDEAGRKKPYSTLDAMHANWVGSVSSTRLASRRGGLASGEEWGRCKDWRREGAVVSGVGR